MTPPCSWGLFSYCKWMMPLVIHILEQTVSPLQSALLYLDANGITVKCVDVTQRSGEVNGVIYTAVDNSTIGSMLAGEWDTIVTSLLRI